MNDEDDALAIYLLVENVRKRRDITNDITPLTVQTNNFNFYWYIAVLYFYVDCYFGVWLEILSPPSKLSSM